MIKKFSMSDIGSLKRVRFAAVFISFITTISPLVCQENYHLTIATGFVS